MDMSGYMVMFVSRLLMLW